MALGRALVRDPLAFLMDEPLSNLDAKLRVQMRAELKRFHQDLNATVIYVTHDQLEAVTMASKLAVMNGGVLQQYELAGARVRPSGEYVCCGVRWEPGDEPGEREGRREPCRRRAGRRQRMAVGVVAGEFAESPIGDREFCAILGARHSTILLHLQNEPGAIQSRVYTVEPTGDVTYVHLFLGNSIIIASVAPDVRLRPDETVWIEFDQDRLHLFDGATERALQAA